MLLPEISPTAGANSDGVLLGSVLQSLFTGTFNSAQMADSAHAYRKDSASGSASFTDISAAVVGGAGGSGIVIIRFATQTRTYQALTSYADNAAAVAAGKLIGQFFRLTATGAVMQVT